MQVKLVMLLVMLFVFIAVLGVSTETEAAQESKWDTTYCWAGEIWTMTKASGYAAGTYKLTGTGRSNLPDNLNLSSLQCAGVWSSIEGEFTSNGYCETVVDDGRIFSKTSRVGGTSTSTLLRGTGRFTGITGSGTSESLGQFPTVREGTIQGCSRGTGTWKGNVSDLHFHPHVRHTNASS
jgi:hypothetical protein